MEEDKSDNEGDKKDSWIVSISFNIISEFCPFNGAKMVKTFFYGSESIRDNCLHPLNKNWTMWSMPECKKDGCPIRVNK
jgi:hypothetical protein